MLFETAARQHIHEIRVAKGLEGSSHVPEAIIKDLEAAAKMLSEDLYQKHTRFIMELIQNADDNRYASDLAPTLHLTYANRFLRVDCNELGFTRENVEAICSIGRSSKPKSAFAGQYIGEKGIGFKAVFKAADVVWISSGDYSFKFDKRERLGMIAPIWDKLPAEKRAGWTSLYIQLSQSYSPDDIVAELKRLDPRLLIFLRRLRTIDITVAGPGNELWNRSLGRREEDLNFNGIQAIQLVQDSDYINYIITRHKISNLGEEIKRPGVSESEAMLAFPIAASWQPIAQNQHVFAFLPVRDYGFKFLIQSDFLLVASREDVAGSSGWNQQIRDQLVDAFLACVQTFNSKDFIKRTWPIYLPERQCPTSEGDFFSVLKSALLERLSREAIVENWNGGWVKPSGLVSVPRFFWDESGTPLTMTDKNSNNYLCSKYRRREVECLTRIGVCEMDWTIFLGELRHLLTSSPEIYNSKTGAWRSKLASVLSALPTELKPQLKELKIIRLRDGDLVCAKANDIFFPGTWGDWEVPGGLGLLVVHPDVIKDEAQYHLYRELGVRNLSKDDTIMLIIKRHSEKPTGRPLAMSKVDLISQTLFLYDIGWRNGNFVHLWAATDQGDRALSHALYIDQADGTTNPATTFFAKSRTMHQFIHPEYLASETGDPKGLFSWLESNLRVSALPHLVTVTDSSERRLLFVMSADFEYIMDNSPWVDILFLLCDHWQDTYGKWLVSKDSNKVRSPHNQLRARLADLWVETTRGRRVRLRETSLPLPAMAYGSADIPFLNIPDPQHERWEYLRYLGVGISDDVTFYLRSLQSLAGTDATLEQFTDILEQIQARIHQDEDAVKKYFEDRACCVLFTMPNSADRHWVPLRQCLWAGPTFMRRHFCLQRVYPTCERLFTGLGQLQDVSLKDMVNEAINFDPRDPLDYIRSTLRHISKFVGRDEDYMQLVNILSVRRIWPVSDSRRVSADTVDRLAAASTASDSRTGWFIADTSSYMDAFFGRVPLLAFPPESLENVARLLAAMSLDNRRLSSAANSTPRFEGVVRPSARYTHQLSSRSEFIKRLVPQSNDSPKAAEDAKAVLHQLGNIEVYMVDRILHQYSVEFNGRKVTSHESPASVMLMPHEDGLKVYLENSYLETERIPEELVNRIASFAGIDRRPDGKGLYLLLIAFVESDAGRIRSTFKNADIPVLESEEDLEGNSSDWMSLGRAGLVSRTMSTITTREGGSFDMYSSVTSDPKSWFGTAIPEVAEEVTFQGEHYFSKFLERTLGNHYNPEEHWTSPLRSRAGVSPYHPRDFHNKRARFPFTIEDTDGIWTALAAKAGFPEAEGWISTGPTWHFLIKTTEGPLSDRFILSPAELDKARKLSLYTQRTGSSSTPSHVLMLIRVFNVDKSGRREPETKLFIDPWDLYTDGALELMPTGYFVGTTT